MTKGACREGDLRLFECGAIALHIAESERSGEALADDRRLLPRDPAARGRAISWLFAALNNVDPQIGALNLVDLARARPFYEALGFTNNPRFSNATGVAMVWSHAKWQGFTIRPICPAGSSEVSLAVRLPHMSGSARRCSAMCCSGCMSGWGGRGGGRSSRVQLDRVARQGDSGRWARPSG